MGRRGGSGGLLLVAAGAVLFGLGEAFVPLAPVAYPRNDHGRLTGAQSQREAAAQPSGAKWAPRRDLRSLVHQVNGDTDIFCNREINMQQIKAMGFDMDHTLVEYNLAFDLLAYDGAKEKLVKNLGYPEAVLNFEYDSTYFRRGLVIDKERGNVLKMDRHKYVRQAYHGFTPLPTAVRKELYMQSSERMPQYTESNFVNLDTLFLLVDAYLFAQLVEYKDTHPGEIKHSYATIYAHIRQCVDLCHRDGVIKDRVAENPAAYILPDSGVVNMLKQYRESGRKTFLVTNSLWEYTHVAMNFLVGNEKPEDRTLDWLELFDVIVVGSRKPGFLMDSSAILLRVDPDDGSLRNVDGVERPVDKFLEQGKVFQGGNWKHLLEMLDIATGDNIMYVGDHMYSDILRTKRSLGWRTCLVIPELGEEVSQLQANRQFDDKLHKLRAERLELDEELDRTYKALRGYSGSDAGERAALEADLQQIKARGDRLDDAIKAACRDYHATFHPIWGKLFEAGFQESRFAKQVSTYACIYTSRASNLGLVSPERWFRIVRDTLPHDVLLDGCSL